MAVDPTYPLYPTLCIVSAFFMFLLLTHSFIRRTWNLAVTLLCIGLFLDNLTHGINAVVWRDNADIKVPVYCDIVSRLQFFMNFLPSITSLLITRKLYMISTMRDVKLTSRKSRLLDLWIEWGWGLGYPVFMTAVVYTLCQDSRFVVLQGFGCASSTSDSWFSVVVISILPVIPPLISIFFYFPLIIRTIYRQRRNLNSLLQSTGSMSRSSFLRILALGCLDIAITLPISLINLVSFFVTLSGTDSLPAYVGWATNHADFAPVGVPYEDITDTPWDSFTTYFDYGQYAVLAVAIFALFGTTASARKAYWQSITALGKIVGSKSQTGPTTTTEGQKTRSGLADSLVFAAPQRSTTGANRTVDLPQRNSIDSGSAPSEKTPDESSMHGGSKPEVETV
ncbi:pheromone A receptor-domain-containing protein [Roridomyces roridus]|uniref:Pheromone A receptor-domain-containing protein n=1 Tax=Roridomyces roridus TaxID=1738132 RepID=A0AAD7B5A1_9AGAR|nr:pheromone A receptor-domain-containing protein [Roridomyces roridus]